MLLEKKWIGRNEKANIWNQGEEKQKPIPYCFEFDTKFHFLFYFSYFLASNELLVKGKESTQQKKNKVQNIFSFDLSLKSFFVITQSSYINIVRFGPKELLQL